MSETSKTVSVIVPVFNAALYLRECIESVLKQSFTDFEVICVDDGSTDDSLKILEEYAAKDPRITIISLAQNRGVSVACNAGVNAAKGKYLYRLDSDDKIDPELLAICCRLVEEHDLDQLIFEADLIVEDENHPHFNYNYPKEICNRILRGTDVLTALAPWKCLITPPTMRFTKMSLIAKGKIFFPEGVIHEDDYFTIRCLLEAERVYVLDRALYHRRLRSNSYMTTRSAEANYWRMKCYFEIGVILLGEAHKYSANERTKLAFHAALKQIRYCVARDLKKLPPESSVRFFKEVAQKENAELAAAVVWFFTCEELENANFAPIESTPIESKCKNRSFMSCLRKLVKFVLPYGVFWLYQRIKQRKAAAAKN